MKIKVEIDEITQKELSTLFEIDTRFQLELIDSPFFRDVNYNDQLSTIENCAIALEEGNVIAVIDYNVDDELDFYGNLPHIYKPRLGMVYLLSLYLLKENLSRALEENPYVWQYLGDWLINGSAGLDADGADILMQYIVFGEIVYA